MHPLSTGMRTAIQYWERRRLVYNLALVPPTLLGYLPGAGLSVAIGDHRYLSILEVGALFLVAALGANICYSFAYAMEFLFATDVPASRWIRIGRPLALTVGILFAMALALVGGRNIAILQYSFR